jgi:hypothetical protein
MQSLPVEPETTACCPRAASPTATGPVADVSASTALPSWGLLPTVRRRRLVTVLGTLVQRTREERLDDP